MDNNRPGIPGFERDTTNVGGSRYRENRAYFNREYEQKTSRTSPIPLVTAQQNLEHLRQQSINDRPVTVQKASKPATPSLLERLQDGAFQVTATAEYYVTEVLHKPLKIAAVAGTIAALGFGANAINQNVIQPSITEYQVHSNDVNQQVLQIINQSKYRTNDGNSWALRTDEVTSNLQELINDGNSPFMVYSSYVTNLSENYLEDERDYISNHLFGMGTDDIAKELGYDGSNNLELQNAMQQSLAQNGTDMETLRADMVLNDIYQNHLSDVKGYGGM